MNQQNTSYPERAVIDVLIVGAGPTGLTATLELARRGIPYELSLYSVCSSSRDRSVAGDFPNRLGYVIERGVELTAVTQGPDDVTVQLQLSSLQRGGSENISGLGISYHQQYSASSSRWLRSSPRAETLSGAILVRVAVLGDACTTRSIYPCARTHVKERNVFLIRSS